MVHLPPMNVIFANQLDLRPHASHLLNYPFFVHGHPTSVSFSFCFTSNMTRSHFLTFLSLSTDHRTFRRTAPIVVTGVASLLLLRGRTAHSLLSIPVEDMEVNEMEMRDVVYYIEPLD